MHLDKISALWWNLESQTTFTRLHWDRDNVSQSKVITKKLRLLIEGGVHGGCRRVLSTKVKLFQCLSSRTASD